MSLTKLEVLNLDLPSRSYKIYKMALKTGIFELSFLTQSLTSGVRQSAGPACKWKENRAQRLRRRGHGVAHRRLRLRRNQSHRRAHHDEPHPWVPRVRSLPASTYSDDMHGGRRRGCGGTPATASLHCPTQARYELHGYMEKLSEKKNGKGEASSAPATVSSISGEVESWRRRIRRMGHQLRSIGSTRGWTR